jgi:hypothetical protein
VSGNAQAHWMSHHVYAKGRGGAMKY